MIVSSHRSPTSWQRPCVERALPYPYPPVRTAALKHRPLRQRKAQYASCQPSHVCRRRDDARAHEHERPQHRSRRVDGCRQPAIGAERAAVPGRNRRGSEPKRYDAQAGVTAAQIGRTAAGDDPQHAAGRRARLRRAGRGGDRGGGGGDTGASCSLAGAHRLRSLQAPGRRSARARNAASTAGGGSSRACRGEGAGIRRRRRCASIAAIVQGFSRGRATDEL